MLYHSIMPDCITYCFSNAEIDIVVEMLKFTSEQAQRQIFIASVKAHVYSTFERQKTCELSASK